MVAVDTALVSGNGLFRQGLRRLLEPHRFVTIAERPNLAGVVTLFGERGPKPRLVIVDFGRPHDRDLEGLARLRAAAGEDCRIVVLAGARAPAEMMQALEAGADGYLVNDLSVDALSRSLRMVLEGARVLPGSLAGAIATDPRAVAADQPVELARNLSGRETQILRCLVNGDSNKRIARVLDIAEGTVKVHLKSLMRKIAASNRTQAALWAHDNGLGSELDAAPVLSPAPRRSRPGRIAM